MNRLIISKPLIDDPELATCPSCGEQLQITLLISVNAASNEILEKLAGSPAGTVAVPFEGEVEGVRIQHDCFPQTKRAEEQQAQEPPHSRACGIRKHPHGIECSTDCPTCGSFADQQITQRKARDLQLSPEAAIVELEGSPALKAKAPALRDLIEPAPSQLRELEDLVAEERASMPEGKLTERELRKQAAALGYTVRGA